MCGFVKCYNFTADVKNFIWDIWSNSASKFNHPPLADNTSVNRKEMLGFPKIGEFFQRQQLKDDLRWGGGGGGLPATGR